MARTNRPANLIKNRSGVYIINPSSITPGDYDVWDLGTGRDAKDGKMYGSIIAEKAKFNCTWKGITLKELLTLKNQLRGSGSSKQEFFYIQFQDIVGDTWDYSSSNVPMRVYEVYMGDQSFTLERVDANGNHIFDFSVDFIER